MSETQDSAGLLMQGAYPTVKLDRVGDAFNGSIVRIGDKFQGKTFGKNPEPAYWDKEKTQPKWIVPIEVEDDATREMKVLNVPQGSQLQSAFAKSVISSGEKAPRVGGHIGVSLAELKPTDGADQKIYFVVYSGPAAGSLMNGNTAPQSPASQPQPVAPVSIPAPTVTQPPVATQPPAGIALPPGFNSWDDMSPEMQATWVKMSLAQQAGS